MKKDFECESEKLGETDPLMDTQPRTTYMSINEMTKAETGSEESVKKTKPSPREPNNILGVNIKRGVTFVNVFGLFYIAAIMTAVSGYINAQMTFLLQSEDHFGVDRAVIGRTNADVLFWANCVPLILCPSFGYVYDIFGRRVPIYTAIFGSILCMSLMPSAAPDMRLLITLRTIQSTFCVVLISNPLIADYIKKDSRGKAISVVAIGMGLGEAFSMTVLFGLSVNMPLD